MELRERTMIRIYLRCMEYDRPKYLIGRSVGIWHYSALSLVYNQNFQ